MITKSPEYFEVMKNIDFVAPQKEKRKAIEKKTVKDFRLSSARLSIHPLNDNMSQARKSI